jgi:hypothetical protein
VLLLSLICYNWIVVPSVVQSPARQWAYLVIVLIFMSVVILKFSSTSEGMAVLTGNLRSVFL